MQNTALATIATRFGLGKIAASVLAIGVATSVTVLGSHASWTAQTRNSPNQVTAGTMSLSNSKDASSIFNATGIKPGDTGSSTVVLGNDGSIPIAVSLTQDNVVNGFAAGSMQLSIHDDTRNWCYFPSNAAGACSTYGTWDASATVNGLAIAATSGAAKWPAAETHTFTVAYQLATSSPNADQGKTASFRLTWDGVQ